MKSGLEDRNNNRPAENTLLAQIVSMKSGLEDRNNASQHADVAWVKASQ